MSADFLPTASLDMLRRRAELLQQVRRFFDERGFLEVETPLLSADVVVDRHLDPIPVTLFNDPREAQQGRRLWLQTSPEFAMKRLLAAGATAIYQIAKAFRGGEAGQLHNPEFTLVEWYRVGDDYAAGMQLLSDLAETVLQSGPAERLTFREAFLQFAKIDPLTASWGELYQFASGGTTGGGRESLSPGDHPHGELVGDKDCRPLPAEDRDALIDLILVSLVEEHLGKDRPCILHDYPASQAALAKTRPAEPPVAERFELYYRGVELANGYHELLDAEVLRERNRTNNALRAADGKYTLPEDSRLLAAMDAGLPACSGCALGLDRLLMVISGAKSIQEVLSFPIDRA